MPDDVLERDLLAKLAQLTSVFESTLLYFIDVARYRATLRPATKTPGILVSHIEYQTRLESLIVGQQHLTAASFQKMQVLLRTIYDYRKQMASKLLLTAKRFTSWNLNKWTINTSYMHQQVQKKRIMKAIRRGPVFLQETKWTVMDQKAFRHQFPGLHCASTITPKNEGGLINGVSIILPYGWQIQSQHVIVPGCCIGCNIKANNMTLTLVSVYCRQDWTKIQAKDWTQNLTHFVTDLPVIIGGDFNHFDTKWPELWQNLLNTLDLKDVDPKLDTYFYPGGQSQLDRFLVSSTSFDLRQVTGRVTARAPITKFGHAPIVLTLKHRPKLAIHPLSTKHATIPSTAFQLPVATNTEGEPPRPLIAITTLTRLLQHAETSVATPMTAKTSLWAWWRTFHSFCHAPNKFRILYKKLNVSSAMVHLTPKQFELLRPVLNESDRLKATSNRRNPARIKYPIALLTAKHRTAQILIRLTWTVLLTTLFNQYRPTIYKLRACKEVLFSSIKLAYGACLRGWNILDCIAEIYATLKLRLQPLQQLLQIEICGTAYEQSVRKDPFTMDLS